MTPDVTVRPASPDDVPTILALVEQSVRSLQQGDYSPSQIDASIGSAFGIDRQLIADQTYFIAETPAGVMAACGGWSYRKTLCGCDTLSARDNATLDPATDFAKIRAIFVHPDFARRGLGTLILAHCESAAQAAGFTRFEMGSTLTGARLYELRGYVEQGRLSVPLPNGEDLAVIHMTKSIS